MRALQLRKWTICAVVLFAAPVTVANDSWGSIDSIPTVTSPKIGEASASGPAGSSSKNPQITSSSGLIAELLMQLEQMQIELAELRGLVERQQQMLDTHQNTAQQRYLDVDKRLALLFNQGLLTDGNQQDLLTTTGSDESNPARMTSEANESAVVIQSSKEAYKEAIKILRSKDYPQARTLFERFIINYPDDSLLANAYYWLGEIKLIDKDLPGAKAAFQKVVDDFPQHSKTADSSYKLGVTLHRLGDTEAAKKILQRVVIRYKDSAKRASTLAARYIENL